MGRTAGSSGEDIFSFLENRPGAGGVAQQGRAFADLAEDLGSVPSVHSEQSQPL